MHLKRAFDVGKAVGDLGHEANPERFYVPEMQAEYVKGVQEGQRCRNQGQ